MNALLTWAVDELRAIHQVWAKKRSWLARLVVLLGVLGLGGLGTFAIHLWRHPESLSLYLRDARRAWHVVVDRGEALPPLSGEALVLLDQHYETWQEKLRDLLASRAENSGYINAWALAQLVLALEDAPPQPSEVTGELLAWREADPPLWKELKDSRLIHVGASSWCLLALSRLGSAAPTDSLDALVNLQAPDGYWPLYPVPATRERASTYATAWGALALSAWKEAPDLTEDRRQALAGAAGRALAWLRDQRREGRWRDYPAGNPEGVESLSLSGLALHAVARLDPEDRLNHRLATQWLASLPQHLRLSLVQKEISGIYLGKDTGSDIKDSVRNYVWPWLVIATADAYQNGGFLDRWRALSWLEEEFALHLEEATEGFEGRSLPWVAAEFGLSLRRLKHGSAVLTGEGWRPPLADAQASQVSDTSEPSRPSS